ncbi:hypothetical protein GBAR_LOCUS27431 [Geodia barretti]|uniref:Uncharacterized protein n=1 Tax=Geodia barretti TaxID=519541 RepID=A0AA35XFR4_GEOBA|nr:hypothetical protein GBAR_LOCUS27431 [Geodia barretti]
MDVKKSLKTVRGLFAGIYIVSWLCFVTGFIMYYSILDHIRRLQLMGSAGMMILLPMLSFSVPGLAIGVLIVFHIISQRSRFRRHVYLAIIMFFSAPYLAGGGVTIFIASAFLGTIRYGSTEANGVPVQWVSLIVFSCFISIGAYIVSVILAVLSNHKKNLYVSRELLRTSEYQPLP